MLAKKPQERPTSREALILIPTFVKKSYEDAKKEKKTNQRMLNVSDLSEASIDDKVIEIGSIANK